MFKCSECGTEFEIKPDYCECGNDSFNKVKSNNNIKNNPLSILKKYNISIFSLLTFIFCLFLSFMTILFWGNPKPYTTDVDNVKETSNLQIPDIDSFWVNTAPINENETPITQATSFKNVVNVFTKPIQQLKNSNPKNELKKTENIKPEPTKSQKTGIKKQDEAIKKQEELQKAQELTKKNQEIATKKRELAAKKEVTQYKIGLRNALFSHLSAGVIEGIGTCGIEFSVNSNGKLINRRFTFQSDNKTLNDEIYKMMMKMPIYTPPPDAYRGELIKIIFEFNNGNYEVHLVN